MEQPYSARLASGSIYLITLTAIIAPILFWRGWGTPALILAAAIVAVGLVALALRRSRFVLVHALHGLTLLLILGIWWTITAASTPADRLTRDVLTWMLAIDLPGLMGFFLFFCFRNAVQGYFVDWPILNWYRRWLMPGLRV